MAIWMPSVLNSLLNTTTDHNDTETYTCLWWYVQMKSNGGVHPKNALNDIMLYEVNEYLEITFNHTSYEVDLQWQYVNDSEIDNNKLIHVNVNIIINNKQNSSNFIDFEVLSNDIQSDWNEFYGTNIIFIYGTNSGVIYNKNESTICGLSEIEIIPTKTTNDVPNINKNDGGSNISKIMDIALIPTICGVISCLFLIFLIWFLKHQNKKKHTKHTHSGSKIEVIKVMHREPVANFSEDVDDIPCFSINDDDIHRSPLPSSPIPPIDHNKNNNNNDFNNIHYPLKGAVNIPIKEDEELNDDNVSNIDNGDIDTDSVKAPTTMSKDVSLQIDDKSDFIINTDDDVLKIRNKKHPKQIKKQKSADKMSDSELLYQDKKEDDNDNNNHNINDDDAVIDIQLMDTNTFQTNDIITDDIITDDIITNMSPNNKSPNIRINVNNKNPPKIKIGEDTPLPDNDDDDDDGDNLDADIVYNLPILNGNDLSHTNTNTHTIDTDDIKLKELYHEEIKKWFDDKLYKLLDARHGYIKLFINNGFDNLSFIKDMTEKDLIQIGINKLGHRKQILLQIQKL